MMFIETYKGDLVNPESIAYLTSEIVNLEPKNIYEEAKIYKLVATMKDFRKIILCHYADFNEMIEALHYLREEMSRHSNFIIDLRFSFASGAVSDCVHFIEEEEEEEL